jgi:hypothetical protein
MVVNCAAATFLNVFAVGTRLYHALTIKTI